MVMLKYVTYGLCFFFAIDLVRTRNASPCPLVFQYKNIQNVINSWDGEITLRNVSTVLNLQLNIILDGQVKALKIPIGKVSTKDGTNFLITNLLLNLKENESYKIPFRVEYYKESSTIPSLKNIYLNRQSICVLSRRTRAAAINEERCPNAFTSQPFIIGGDFVNYHMFPWHVAIYRHTGNVSEYICGGSLITKRHILTAAHCVTRSMTSIETNDPNIFTIYLGAINRQKLAENHVQKMSAIEVNIPLNFEVPYLKNDIAVITLAKEVRITEQVKLICIWDSTSKYKINDKKAGKVAGWGFDKSNKITDDLKYITMPIVPETDCFKSNKQFYSEFLSGRNYCAGKKDGHSVCNGDSGGGMVVNTQDGLLKLLGLVSLGVYDRGEARCHAEEYVLFTNVSDYIPWINNTVTQMCGINRSFNKSTEFPWDGILLGGNGTFPQYVTLITKKHALTLASFFVRSTISDYAIHLGYNMLTDKAEQVKTLESALLHPQFNKNAGKNDIAILTLSSRIQYTDFVRPICLPVGIDLPFSKLRLFVPNQDVISPKEMHPTKFRLESPASGCQRANVKGNFCANSTLSSVHHRCFIGGGTAAVFYDKDISAWQLKGIFSGNNSVCEKPMSFIDVTHYQNWILEHVDFALQDIVIKR